MSMDNKVGGAGGDSNTPPKTDKARATCIDYFTFRINSNYEKERHLFRNLLKILHVDQFEAKKSKGRNNYEYAVSLAIGTTILYGGEFTINKNGEETSVLEIKGQGCRDFEERYYGLGRDFKKRSKEEVIREGWIALFEECLAMGGACTRIDLPTDDFSGLITVDEIKDKLHKKEFSTRSRKLGVTESEIKDESDIDNKMKKPSRLNGVNTIEEGSGFSATFGNTRHVQLCIYDKKAETSKKGLLRKIDSWIRYEVRYFHRNAELVLPALIEALRKGEESKYIVSCLNGLIEFKEANTYSSKDKYRNKTWSKWAQFIGDAGKRGGFGAVPKVMTFESNASWLAIDASAALGKVSSCLDHIPYNELMAAFIILFARKNDKEHLQVINQYRRSKGLPLFKSMHQVYSYHMSRPDFPESFHKETIEFILKIKSSGESKKDEDKEDDDNA